MRTVNTQRYDTWDDEVQVHDVIYLQERYAYDRERSRSRRRRNANRSEAFWNVIFTVLCLSVLACLFLH